MLFVKIKTPEKTVIKVLGITVYLKQKFSYQTDRKIFFFKFSKFNLNYFNERINFLIEQNARLEENLKKIVRLKYLNERIRQAKYVHFVINDKFIQPYVSLIESRFNSKEHLFLCKKALDYIDFPRGESVAEFLPGDIKSLEFTRDNKFIFQSAFDTEVVKFFAVNKNLLSKTAWFLWGGDLYNAQRNDIEDTFRREVRIVSCCVKKDYLNVVSTYNSHNMYVKATIPGPISKIDLIKYSNKKSLRKKSTINIQINNSADKTTLDMLKVLSRFKNEDICITTILSYGDLEFADEIVKLGKEIFKEKFIFIDKYMSADEYTNHLSHQDIFILYQNRQQGLGNITSCLAMGSKCYVRHDVSSIDFFNDLLLKVFDSRKIKNMSFSEFIDYEPIVKVENINNALKIYSEDEYVKGFSNLFKALENL